MAVVACYVVVPIALVDRAAGGLPHRKGAAERREDFAGIVHHPL